MLKHSKFILSHFPFTIGNDRQYISKCIKQTCIFPIYLKEIPYHLPSRLVILNLLQRTPLSLFNVPAIAPTALTHARDGEKLTPLRFLFLYLFSNIKGEEPPTTSHSGRPNSAVTQEICHRPSELELGTQ